ncbi:polysaccharide deacetylase family protein [Aequorivita xiaoshiensis]|uniref:Polysaccharide deacetylase family protein n=1 Tax=Aequorivita xiaoshiensis TaxID=2874476 RepID=A0A9X1R4T9_9FLAO|nr:polysaccharide deacetylase family protein [Aequorivita xiaoshiensis]MCG2431558.1 polysaccharide deacetylase family protein [Aequorivita xiaoshiensis]
MKKIMYVFMLSAFIFSCKDNSKKDETQKPSTVTLEESVENLTDSIQVKNIQIGSDTANDKNKFHLSYPSTVYDFINKNEDEFAQSYLSEFKDAAKKVNDEAVAGLDFGQHFEIIESTPSIIAFLIERYTSYGNNYNSQYFTHIYDIKEKKKLEFSTIFSPQDNFDKLAEVVKSKTSEILREKISALQELTDDDKKVLWKNSQEMIDAGTKANDKNYHAFSWDKSGNLTIYFDKYQVASGNHGNIEIKLAPESYKHLVAKKYQFIFHIQPQTQEEDTSTTAFEPDQSSTKTYKIDCSKEPCVALTFDDGPATHTTQLLDILKKHDVKATFFVLGKSAKVQKNTLLRAYKEGHQIGNHSWDHKDLKKLSDEEIVNQIFKTNDVISNITGEEVNVMRPPYGSFNDIVKNKANMPIILWNLDPLDWKDRNAETVAKRISEADINGIVLAHDIHKTTVEAMPEVISNLKSKGYHLVTIDNLFAGKDLVNGKTYSRRK